MQNYDTTAIDLDEIDTHAKRAWALTSVLITHMDHKLEGHPGKQEMIETLLSIFEHLDGIGAEFHKGAAQ